MRRNKNLTLLYALVQFTYWMGFAAISAFASTFLLGYRVSNTTIGAILAIANIITAVLQPVLGTLSDKYPFFSVRRLTGFFMILVMLMAAALLVIHTSALAAICIFYGICILGMSMAQPFVNSIGMLYLNAGYQLDFGMGRAAGSLGYAICAFMLGRMADQIGIKVIPAAFGIAFGLLLVILPVFPKLPEKVPDLKKDSDYKKDNGSKKDNDHGSKLQKKNSKSDFFQRYPSFTIMLLGLVGIYFGHILINNFTLQIVETKGGASSEMGTATALAAMTELLMMFLFTRIMKKVSLRTLLRISGIFFTLKVLGSLLVTNMTGYYLVQLMQFLGWGIMSVGLVYYVNEIMAPEDCVKGQAYASMTYTIGSVAGAWIGGTMLDMMGVPAMLICGIMVSAIGAAIIWIGTLGTK